MATAPEQITIVMISTQQAAALVARAQQGDQVAFAILYEHYRPLVYRFLRRRLGGSDEVAEDLTEDVFIKLYQKLDLYTDRGRPFVSWLSRMMRNQLIDHIRALPRRSVQSLDVIADQPDRHAVSEYGGVLNQQVLEPALARLTAEQCRAVELRFLQGMSVAEAATTMGRSDDAVKKLTARALVNLRRSLTPAAESPASHADAAP